MPLSAKLSAWLSGKYSCSAEYCHKCTGELLSRLPDAVTSY